MLAVKTLTAASRLGLSGEQERPPGVLAPALIFDEVDAGIGGRVADAVGRALWRLGSAFQVLCITHLPQIAAYGDAHFLIDKQVTGGRTTTSVSRLVEDARVEELSRMLAGAALSDSVRATAREMLAGRWSAVALPQAEGLQAKAKGEGESGGVEAQRTRRTRPPRDQRSDLDPQAAGKGPRHP